MESTNFTDYYSGAQLPSILAQTYEMKKRPMAAKADGSYIYDESGKKYLDLAGATAAVNSIGHNDKEIAELLRENISQAFTFTTHYFNHPFVEEFLQNLVEFAGPDFTKAFPSTGGTESVEHALKLAYQYHKLKGRKGRYKILSRLFSYHGTSITALSVSDVRSRCDFFREILQNDHPKLSACHPYRRLETETIQEFEDRLIKEAEEVLQREKPETICAFLAEPISGSTLGAAVPTPNYFSRLEKLFKQYDILMISDEVMTGFGRTGKKFGYEHFNFSPDILTCAKGISSGMLPLGAVLCRKEIQELFDTNKKEYASSQTFSFHPLACFVGAKTINALTNRNLVERGNEAGNYFWDKLNSELSGLATVGEIRGRGLILGVEIVQDKANKKSFSNDVKIGKKIADKAFENGIITFATQGCNDGKDGDVLFMAPALSINNDEINFAVDVLKESIQSITNEK